MVSPVEDAADKNLGADSNTVIVDDRKIKDENSNVIVDDEKINDEILEEIIIVQPDVTPTPEQLEEEKPSGKGRENGDGKKENNLKSTLVISGVVIAVIGTIFAIIKKVKHA